jgi:hypothetical protein
VDDNIVDLGAGEVSGESELTDEGQIWPGAGAQGLFLTCSVGYFIVHQVVLSKHCFFIL